MVASGSPKPLSLVLCPAVSLLCSNPAGSHDHPARDARALAQRITASFDGITVRASATESPRQRTSPIDRFGPIPTFALYNLMVTRLAYPVQGARAVGPGW
jgi:hypothetical protein